MDSGGTRGSENFSGKRLEHVHSNTLEALRSLGKPAESIRIQAALTLFRKIIGKPYEQKIGDDQDKNEVDYVLERLVRGVGSSRNSSRTGHFAALASMLYLFPVIHMKDVIEIVKKELSKGKNVSKSEAADIHMGQVLVYGAIIKSGRFLETSEEVQCEILTNLITAGGKRTYLTLVANSFIIELIKVANKKLFKKVIWPAIQVSTGVQKDAKDRSLDEIYLLLSIKTHFPKIISEEDSLLHGDNVLHCASILMNIPNVSYMKHPVYEEYCHQVASTEHVLLFWSDIEKHLLKQNRNRQLIALEMLRHIFTHLEDKTKLPEFISPPFINIILKSKSSARKSQENEMHDIFSKVKELFPTLMSSLQSDAVSDKTKVEVLKRLLFYPGNFMIEKNTGLKIVQPITTSLTVKGVKKLAKVYQDVVSGKLSINKEDGNSQGKPDFKALPWKNKERIYAAQLLARLVGITLMASEHDWKFEQAKFLLHWGVFNKHLGHSNSGAIGVVGLEVAHALRESFFRCLDHKAGGLNGSINLLSKLVNHVNELLTDDSVEEKALKGKVLEDWEKAMKVIRKLENQIKEDDAKESKAREVGGTKVFLLLFFHLALQLFDWDAKLASESLEELYTCYAKMEQEKHQSKKSVNPMSPKSKKHNVTAEQGMNMQENGEVGNPVWVEVVVDLFLNLLSQNRHLLRSIVCSVFGHLCLHLTATALHSILQVLDVRSGKNPLLDKEDESDDEENNEEEAKDSEEESDEEAAADDEDVSGDESDDGGEEEDEEPTVNETLRLAVQKALGTAASTSDTESVDVDEIGEEEGQQLDAALSGAFRLLKDSKDSGKVKKQQSKDERMLTHFRVRSVDLLEIFIESAPSMTLCCDLILPLLETLEFCIRDTHQKPLENRLRSCFKKLSSIKSFSATEGMEDEILIDLLNALLDKGSKTSPIYLEMGNEIMHCCTFVVKSSEFLRKQKERDGVNKKKKKKSEVNVLAIPEIYKKSLETFFTKRDCLLPVGMFRQALQVPWPGRWCMLPILVRYGFDKEVRPFRRNQALDLLKAFFLNISSLSGSQEINREELVSVKEEISSQSKKFLEHVAELQDPSKMGKKCLVCLMNLLQAIRSSEHHKKSKDDMEVEENSPAESGIVLEGMDWNGIGALLSSLYCTQIKVVSADGKRAVGKLLRLIGLGEVITRQQAEKSQKTQEAKVKKENQENAVVKKENEENVVKKENGENVVIKKENGETFAVDGEESEESSDDEDNVIKTKVSNEDKEKEKREKKKKRKRSSKIESRKLKKEAKAFRMQEFSKGLEDSSFAGMATMPASEDGDGVDNLLGEGKRLNINKKRKSDSPSKERKKMKIHV